MGKLPNILCQLGHCTTGKGESKRFSGAESPQRFGGYVKKITKLHKTAERFCVKCKKRKKLTFLRILHLIYGKGNNIIDIVRNLAKCALLRVFEGHEADTSKYPREAVF